MIKQAAHKLPNALLGPDTNRQSHLVFCTATRHVSSLRLLLRGEVVAHFHAVAVLACQDEFFVNNPFDVKKKK
jgi:hypothetical protein